MNPDLTVAQAVFEFTKLEHDIEQYINDRMNSLFNDFGVSPSGIEIELNDLGTRNVVGKVNLTIRLHGANYILLSRG